MTAARDDARTSLRRLRDATAALGPIDSLVEIGGRVTETAPGHVRVSGVETFARLGDRLSGETAAAFSGEIVHLDARGALAKPAFAAAPPRLGEWLYLQPAESIRPTLAWRGRAVDALGRPLDGGAPLPTGADALSLLRAPPPALQRAAVGAPIRTGVRAVDAFAPLCQGQRIGLFAGSGVGKSTLLAMLARADGFDDIVVGLVGERGREVREFLEGPLTASRDRTIAVVATGDESAIMRRRAARLAMALAEWLRDQGRRVLLMLDSLTRLAQAAREIAISAGEPPVARGYPPSVLAELPALLERAGPGLSPAGSITAVATVLVDGDDHNDPIADAIRGILDGHIVLDRDIANRGRFPAIDILASISRLADRAWSAEQRDWARDIRQRVALFEETRDLRAMGGYRPGSDATLDAAVATVPRLYACLAQRPDEPACVDPFADLNRALEASPAARAQSPADGR